MVLHHVLDSECFQINDLVFVNQFLGRLVQMVLPNVLDPLVYSCQLHTKFLDPFRLLISRLLLTFAELPLHTLQLSLQRPVRLDVGILLIITVYDQRLDAEIDTDFLIYWLVMFDLFLDQECTVILSTLVFGDRAIRDFLLDFTMDDALDAFQELRDDELAVYQSDVLWYTEALLTVLVLEGRELCSLFKEVTVGGIEVLDGVLQALAVYFFEPSDGLLQLGQFFAVTDEVIAPTSGEVFLFASCEKVVVEVSAATKVFGKQCLLFSGWSKTKPICVIYSHELI